MEIFGPLPSFVDNFTKWALCSNMDIWPTPSPPAMSKWFMNAPKSQSFLIGKIVVQAQNHAINCVSEILTQSIWFFRQFWKICGRSNLSIFFEKVARRLPWRHSTYNIGSNLSGRGLKRCFSSLNRKQHSSRLCFRENNYSKVF